MLLSEKIDEELKIAVKEKNVLKTDVLRMLKAAIINFLIEKKKNRIEDEELLGLIQKQVKLREDSIESYKKGGRLDLVDKETKEKAILQSYLPKALAEEELRELVRRAIQTTGAKSKADLGKVMKEALAQAKGRADGKRLSQIVAQILPS